MRTAAVVAGEEDWKTPLRRRERAAAEVANMIIELLLL